MAHYTIRCNLVSATFPFFTEGWGRSIIIPQYDLNYDRQAAASIVDYDKDKGIPQIYYAHNIMPTSQGVQAVGFNEVISNVGAVEVFDKAFPILTSGLNRIILSPASGDNYIFDASVGVWNKNSAFPPGSVPDNVQVTIAFVQGQTYICYANYKIMVYNETTKLLEEPTFIGITVANIKAICASNGYLIAITSTEVAWSSLLDPLDFTPSLDTGAGSGTLNEAIGTLNFCLPIPGGFMIYCDSNVVSAIYTGNINYPFAYRSVNGSGNVTSADRVSWQSNQSEHYVWSVNGVQKLNRTEATSIFPELSDFFSKRIFEDFDESTLTFTTSYLTESLYVNTTSIANRYIVFSYGVSYTEHTHALIYDLVLKRFGKIKLNHRDCFQWNAPNLYGDLSYDELSDTYSSFGPDTSYDDLGSRIDTPFDANAIIAFLQKDGTVKLLDMSLGSTIANGVVLSGKYQFLRNDWIVHQTSEIENVKEENNFDYYIIPSLDGKTLRAPVRPKLISSGEQIQIYGRMLTAKNLSFLFVGNFNLVSFVLEFTLGGDN